MKSLTVMLDGFEKVNKFVQIAAAFDGDLDLISGRYVVDAKSIMGIYSLDLKNTLTLNIERDDEFNKAKEKFSEFIA